MNIAALLVLFSAIVYWQLPNMWKKEYKGEIILYLSLISIDLGLSISQALQVHLPIISDGIIYLFQPLKDMVYRSLE